MGSTVNACAMGSSATALRICFRVKPVSIALLLMAALGCATNTQGHWAPRYTDAPRVSLYEAQTACTERHGTSAPYVAVAPNSDGTINFVARGARRRARERWEAQWKACMNLQAWFWSEGKPPPAAATSDTAWKGWGVEE